MAVHFYGNHIRISVLFLLMSLAFVNTWAQTQPIISGRVTDAKGEVLPMASVAVKGTSTGTYTDDKGTFTLNVKPGILTLIVQYMGFETEEVKVDARKSQHLDISMHESGYNLGDVTITAKSNEQRLREGAYAVNALDIKSIASSVTNLNELVSRSSGVNLRTDGGLGSNFELSLNGLSGNSIRYFVDGIPLTSKGNGVNLSNFPINSIDRIEVYKGVVPSYLGGDALGGAINIVTKQEKKNFLDASVSVGSFHTYTGEVNAQIVLPKSGILVRPQLNIIHTKDDYKMHDVEVWNAETSEYETVTRKRFHDAYHHYMAQMEVGVEKKKWADVFLIGASYTKNDKELQTGTIQTIVYGKAERQEEAINLQAKYTKKDFLLKNLALNLYAGHTWDNSVTIDTTFHRYNWNGESKETSRNELTGRERSMRHYKRPTTILRGNVNYVFNEHHSLSFNYLMSRTGNRRFDTADDYYPYLKDTFEETNDLITRQTLGLSYEQSWMDGRWVNSFFVKDYVNHVSLEQEDTPSITGADKAEKNVTKNNVGGGIGTRFTIMEPLHVKLSYERAERLPLARELLGNGSTTYPNLLLRPEKSHNVNLGLFGNIKTGGMSHLYYEVTAFYRKVTDYIRLRVNDNDGTAEYENVSNVTTKGIEGEVRYSLGRWLQTTANVSFQESLDMNEFLENGSTSATYKNRVPNKPWLNSNLDLTLTKYDLFGQGDRLRFNTLYQYVHWFYLSWEGYGYLPAKARIPSQHMVNASLTYSWHQERYSITVSCDNVLDKLAFDNYKLQKPGRSFTAKFRLYLR